MSDLSYAEACVFDMVDECGYILQKLENGADASKLIDDFMDEMQGFEFFLRRTNALGIISDRTPHGIRVARGWLKANVASITNPPSTTTVSASSMSSASVDNSIDVAIDMACKCQSLAKEDKDALELALERMRKAASKGDEKGFAEKLKEALDIGTKAVGAIPLIANAAAAIAQAL